MSTDTAILAFITTEIASGDETVDTETDLLLTGLVDSIGVMRIVEWIETTHGIEIDPTDVILENFQTVAAMSAYVDDRLGAASG